MKFNVKGNIKATKRLVGRKFEIEVEAASEKHARSKAVLKLGSTQSLGKNRIEVLSVEAVGDSKGEA